jgi:3-dehydroquinate synthase class II
MVQAMIIYHARTRAQKDYVVAEQKDYVVASLYNLLMILIEKTRVSLNINNLFDASTTLASLQTTKLAIWETAGLL